MSPIKLGITQSPKSQSEINELYPTYGTTKSACFDLRADLRGREVTIVHKTGPQVHYLPEGNTVLLHPQERVLIPSGCIFDIPEGYRLEIVPRSGRTWKDALVVMNSPARIDEDYELETFVILQNQGFEPVLIKHGEKIAQAEINLVTRVDLPIEAELRNGGFGSTGN